MLWRNLTFYAVSKSIKFRGESTVKIFPSPHRRNNQAREKADSNAYANCWQAGTRQFDHLFAMETRQYNQIKVGDNHDLTLDAEEIKEKNAGQGYRFWWLFTGKWYQWWSHVFHKMQGMPKETASIAGRKYVREVRKGTEIPMHVHLMSDQENTINQDVKHRAGWCCCLGI